MPHAVLDRLALTALKAAPPELAHRLTLRALAAGLRPQVPTRPADPRLAQSLFGLDFASPVGVAAGFDKNAEAVDPLLGLGAGFVEVGAVTPRPQAGNPKPRLFRLTADAAVINRMGFNNDGLAAAADRLRARRNRRPGPVWANVGANKNSVDREADYVAVLRGLWGLVDLFVINVSSPNTEGLRALQAGEALKSLAQRVVAERDALQGETGLKPAVLVKIAPDLDAEQLQAAADAMLAAGVDGAVATNTTLARPGSLRAAQSGEKGGLSGAPLFEASTEILRQLRRATGGALPLVGVGGVGSADHAYAKVRAGASLVQLYTALVYAGPALFTEIATGLSTRLAQDGFAHLSEAVGADA